MPKPRIEPLRYLENAKELLKKSPIEDDDYLDIKYVKQAFGAAYLAILEAINEALTKKGFIKKELPRSVDGYIDALNKHLAVHNGKLAREFDSLYDALHIAGYYRGLLRDVNVVKDYFKRAEVFIKKLNPVP